MSTLNKVLARVVLERQKDAVDKRLRPEQAGFRQDKSCTGHIATLRIIEQSIEWQSPLYLTFVDFEKALDSIDRGDNLEVNEPLWYSTKIYQHNQTTLRRFVMSDNTQ